MRLADVGPAAAGFWRLALALPLLVVPAPRGSVGKPSRLALAAGVFFALDLATWHYALRYTSVATATVLPNLTPVVVTIGAWALLGERPSRAFLAGLAAAVAGAALMALADTRAGAVGRDPPLGDFLAALTALAYSAYMLAIRRARASRSARQLMSWTSLVGAPLMLLLALALRERVWPGSIGGWGAVAGLAVAQVAGQGAIAWALGRLAAATASVTVVVQPVASALMALALFGERLSLLQGLGGALALGGGAAAQAGAAREESLTAELAEGRRGRRGGGARSVE